ncbi:unnamed protein product, partial [Rodentolepis nana]|uniref:2-phosphoxylose phosphatase 1 n=1 Tax=Rodentolepis nana TaxID=102285 RepID=A0A0R3TYY2_RODNA
HNGFPIPRELAKLERDIDYYSAVEILSEILGKRETWRSRLNINIGPVLHIILSKMLNYTNNPPLQLYAIHDASILPILLALDSWDEAWPPFAADITFELHLQTSGPSYKPSSPHKVVEFEPNSQLDWSSVPFERLWVRVLYLGQPLPMTTTWMKGEVDLEEMTGSGDFIPLVEFVRRLAPFALSMEDFQAKCQENANKLKMDHRDGVRRLCCGRFPFFLICLGRRDDRNPPWNIWKGNIWLSKIELNLVQVQVFFRHGARTPLHLVRSSLAHAEWTPDTTKDIPEVSIAMQHVDIYNRTPVDEASYDLIYRPIKLPGGESIGMLTSIGQKDLFYLGVELRKRYSGEGGILSDPPKLNEIETRSTRVGRNLKSIRSLVAGICNNEADGVLVVPTMDFAAEVLFPNPKLNGDDTAYVEGTEELRNDPDILALKKKIREALKVDRLIDELDNDPQKYSRDCQVYYVRDDYAARKVGLIDQPFELYLCSELGF